MSGDPVKNAAGGVASPLPVGATVDRYQLCQEVASGGMGRVYLARQRGPAGFEKLVALKTIHAELAEEGNFVEMFLDEARIASRIDHPNVCRVYDFGRSDGTYYLAMEYLFGEALSRVGRAIAKSSAKPPVVEEVLIARLVSDAAEGLHAAHELTDETGRPLQVVHRDVSPQNIFVTYDGGVRIVDFGIASAAGRLHQTSTGSLKGKFSYMAPEQMKREPVDRRTDVWALGVVLFELLTRRRLFKAGNEIELILSVLNDPVPRPSSVRPGVPRELDEIVLRALTKDRAKRYATARELSRDLQRFILGRGEIVGMAELGEWMARLFPEEKRAKREMLDRARAMPEEMTPRVSLAGTSPMIRAPRPSSAPLAPRPPSTSTADSTEPDMPAAGEPEFGPEVTRERALTTPARPASLGALVVPAVVPSKPGVSAPAPMSDPELAPRRARSSRARAVVGIGIGIGLVLALAGVSWWLAIPRAPGTTPPLAAAPQSSQHVDAPAPAPGSTAPALPSPATAPDTPTAPAPTPAEPPAHAPASPRSASPSASPHVRTVAAEPAGRGMLSVSAASGWATVFVDGQSVGRTPVTVPADPGRHVVEMRPFGLMPLGRGPARRTVTVFAGRTTRLRAPASR